MTRCQAKEILWQDFPWHKTFMPYFVVR